MYPIELLCPACGSDDITCVSRQFFLYVCNVCEERFSDDEMLESREKSSKYRTRPRRGYQEDIYDDGT